ncbi:PREDICTED: non-specific lipid-transfer protein-like protein At2g13820 [Tarenaya hassleriana]|uniref:non-specific lipid-transfer protein-like protein At2g13820 n=1 Tax=Tarenaya hassleriana TaxID=28532 RepID=UPI00053C73BB|nr:PREDICTED: non-specific lipid-transfer protein-like protein At2g13820 [Tarenaya hassleriana]
MKMEMGFAFLTVLAVMLFSTASAQSSSCTNVLISMSPCLNYITGNSSTPSQQCCSQLGNVVSSSPECLCQVLNGGGSQLGINVNQTQALGLPRACNVQTPPVSSCNGGSSAGSPAGSPNTSGTENRPGNGSKTVPSGEGGSSSSDGSSTKLSFSLLAFLSVASCVAIFSA